MPGDLNADGNPGWLSDVKELLETFEDAILVLDREWRCVYANAAARQTGLIGESDLNSRPYWEIFPALAGTKLEQRACAVMQTRRPDHIEDTAGLLGPWVSVKLQPSRSGVTLVFRTPAEKSASHEAHDSPQARLQQVFDATSDAIVMLDRNYIITFANRRAQELLAPSGNVLGKSIWTSFPNTIYEGSPYIKHFRACMEHGVTRKFEAYYPEPLDYWITVGAYPASDGLIIFFRDITPQRATEQELKARQQETERQKVELEATYDTAPVGLALFDSKTHRYLRLNQRLAEMLGLSPEKILGNRLYDMVNVPGIKELFDRTAAGEIIRDYVVDGTLATSPNVPRYWNVSYSPVRGPDGQVVAISTASLEITQQKRAENALLRSEKLAAVGRLASSISHEINNPLESITNLLYLISLSPDLTPKIRGYLDKAQDEVSRVSHIATQTLRFHRQSVKPTNVSAHQLIQDVLDLYRGRLANSGIETVFRSRDTSKILCFENDIRQVLNNLISNAIDAMRRGGKLFLRTHEASTADGPGIRITVADTGHGMSPETLSRLYEPFYTTKDLNGTGLGMWISQNIIERHKGALHVRSSQDPVHHGTVFALFLPHQTDPAL